MKENYLRSLHEVLKSEGGNDDDPLDHGGRTSRGITQREYDAWRQEQGQVVRDVWTASQAEVESIYKGEYWDPYGDVFPKGIDYLYFDMCVNAGPRRAAILLQRALGVTADGRVGPITRMAVFKADPRSLILRYSQAKREFYRSLHQPRFIKGWLNRTEHVQKAALEMIK